MLEDILNNITQDNIAVFILIVFVAVYGLLSLVMAFQIQVLDRMVRQVSFSRIFRFLGFANVIISAILLLVLLFAL